MGTLFPPILILLFSLSFPLFSSAQTCTSETFASNKLYSTCTSLSELSGTLHWTYLPQNGTAEIAYRVPQVSTGWVGWAINPKSSGMIGANALLAYLDSSTGSVKIISSVLTSYLPDISDSNLTFQVYSRSAEYSNGSFTIYATIELPGNVTTQNIAWQAGTDFQSGLPNGHKQSPPNTLAKTSLDFGSGFSFVVTPASSSSAADSQQRQKNIHGVLNALGWGILLPLGVILARYIKALDTSSPTWFYAHVTCQITGFILGVAGFGLGLKLGNESKGITYHRHRTIGILLFCLAIIQVCALCLRPKPTHKHRTKWNFYHYIVGFFIILLSVINIYKGFNILNPDMKYKRAYTAVIATLAVLAVILEICKWTVCRKRKSVESEKPQNGNGY
ncbi:hypothetical protein LUZ60_006371 [Juncus effusus]|nr:hypothetical protein LUZ60_006371 [Juncus effusus]